MRSHPLVLFRCNAIHGRILPPAAHVPKVRARIQAIASERTERTSLNKCVLFGLVLIMCFFFAMPYLIICISKRSLLPLLMQYYNPNCITFSSNVFGVCACYCCWIFFLMFTVVATIFFLSLSLSLVLYSLGFMSSLCCFFAHPMNYAHYLFAPLVS